MNCNQCNKEIDTLGYLQGFETCLKCTKKNIREFTKRGY